MNKNYVINENTYVCRMQRGNYGMTAEVSPISPLLNQEDRYITNDNVTFTATAYGLNYINNTFYGGEYPAVSLCELDENRNIIFIDTECYPVTKVGGLSNYVFEAPGEYNVEIEMFNDYMPTMFSVSPITNVEIYGFAVMANQEFAGCYQLKSVVLPESMT